MSLVYQLSARRRVGTGYYRSRCGATRCAPRTRLTVRKGLSQSCDWRGEVRKFQASVACGMRAARVRSFARLDGEVRAISYTRTARAVARKAARRLEAA